MKLATTGSVPNTNTAFNRALEIHGVQCQVLDIDHQRSLVSFGAVDTQYIIQVKTNPDCDERCRFKTFSIEKSFHDFRQLVAAFKKAAKDASDKARKKDNRDGKGRHLGWKGVPESTQNLIAFTECFAHVIEAEPISTFVGKMTFGGVQDMGKERSKILEKALRVLTENYPDSESKGNGPASIAEPIQKFITIVNDFFLTDHIYEEDDDGSTFLAPVSSVPSMTNSPSTWTAVESAPKTRPKKNGAPSSPISTPSLEKETVPSTPSSTIRKSTTIATGSITTPTRAQSGPSPTQQNQNPGEQVKLPLQDSEVVPRSIRKRRKAKKAPLHSSSRSLFSEGGDGYGNHARHTNNFIHEKKGKPDVMENPLVVCGILFLLTNFFALVPPIHINIGLDISMVILFAAFLTGMKSNDSEETTEESAEYGSRYIVSDHTLGSDDLPPSRQRVNSETLMKKSMNIHTVGDRKASNRKKIISTRNIISTTLSSIVGATMEDEEEDEKAPLNLKRFPDNAEIGSLMNCWSEPIHSEFSVRGGNYLKDKVKISSGPFLFPLRGVDMFLSDNCPENIGRYRALLGGKLRDKPTFLINYRLPWGNFVAYNEIPAKFLPFLRHCYQPTSATPPSMEGMSPAEVCTSRYFLANEKQKDETLKIIPKVVKGPWIVKKAADGKPAIVCNKMPTQYYYEPASKDGKKSEYFEVDLDIVASSAARGILAITQRYTKSLTLDLGFVLEGKTSDQLPEQMIAGSRIHGLDPLSARILPDSFDGVL